MEEDAGIDVIRKQYHKLGKSSAIDGNLEMCMCECIYVITILTEHDESFCSVLYCSFTAPSG